MTAPLCPHCGRPVLGIDPDLRRQYEAACERAGVPAAPPAHPRRWRSSTPEAGRYAQEAGCAAATAEVARG